MSSSGTIRGPRKEAPGTMPGHGISYRYTGIIPDFKKGFLRYYNSSVCSSYEKSLELHALLVRLVEIEIMKIKYV
jgi:hypothetical protein